MTNPIENWHHNPWTLKAIYGVIALHNLPRLRDVSLQTIQFKSEDISKKVKMVFFVAYVFNRIDDPYEGSK